MNRERETLFAFERPVVEENRRVTSVEAEGLVVATTGSTKTIQKLIGDVGWLIVLALRRESDTKRAKPVKPPSALMIQPQLTFGPESGRMPANRPHILSIVAHLETWSSSDSKV